MTRMITFYLPPDWADGMKESWKWLAEEVIEEAGQRGAKSSKLFQMICDAGIANHTETTRLLREIKSLLPS